MTRTFTHHNDHDAYAHLTALAHDALPALGLPAGSRLTLLNAVNNAVYRVDDADGAAAYALRITRSSDAATHAGRESLAVWLRHLAEAGLRVPLPVREPLERTGYRLALFRWVPGESLPVTAYSAAHVEAVGRAAGHLHTAAQGFTPPEGFQRPRLDADSLTGKAAADGTPSQYASHAEDSLFTANQQALLRELAGRVQAAFDAVGSRPGAFGLIHADLIAKNIVFDGDPQQVGLLDFDECAFGLDLYDLTPLLWLQRNAPDYDAFRAALWQGYTSVRPLPEAHRDHLETLVAARHAASCRWVAANAHKPALQGRYREVLDTRFAELASFLANGSFRAGPQTIT